MSFTSVCAHHRGYNAGSNGNRARICEAGQEMGISPYRLIGIVIAVVGSFPNFEILQKRNFLWRGDSSRTTRQQDPIGYWGTVGATTLLALVATAAGDAIFAGALKP
jgi:hypothetical protein